MTHTNEMSRPGALVYVLVASGTRELAYYCAGCADAARALGHEVTHEVNVDGDALFCATPDCPQSKRPECPACKGSGRHDAEYRAGGTWMRMNSAMCLPCGGTGVIVLCAAEGCTNDALASGLCTAHE